MLIVYVCDARVCTDSAHLHLLNIHCSVEISTVSGGFHFAVAERQYNSAH